MSNIELTSKDYVDSKSGSSYQYVSEHDNQIFLTAPDVYLGIINSYVNIGEMGARQIDVTGNEINFNCFKINLGSPYNRNDSIFINGPLYNVEGEELELAKKSKTWYCRCLPLDMDVWFDSESIKKIPYLTEAWAWEKRNAKMVFEKEMSITEVNKALCYLELFSGPCFKTEYYSAYAVCPFDNELEAMIPSSVQKIK